MSYRDKLAKYADNQSKKIYKRKAEKAEKNINDLNESYANAYNAMRRMNNAARNGNPYNAKGVESVNKAVDKFGSTLEKNRNLVSYYTNGGNDAYKSLYANYRSMRKSPSLLSYNALNSPVSYEQKDKTLDKKEKKLTGKRIGETALSLAAAFGGGDVNSLHNEYNNNKTARELASVQNQRQFYYERDKYQKNINLIKSNKKLKSLLDKAYTDNQYAQNAIESKSKLIPNYVWSQDADVSERLNAVNDYRRQIRNMGYDDAELLDIYTRDRNEEEVMAANAEISRFAEKHPVTAGLAYVAANPMQMKATPEIIASGVKEIATGEYAPIDIYSRNFLATQARDTISNTVSDLLTNKAKTEKGKKVANFLYQTGLSMGDFLSLAPLSVISEGVPLFIMGTSAGVKATKDATERGLDASHAMWTGLAAGAAEVVFEKISLDRLLSMSPTTRLQAIIGTLGQAFTEGSEEVFTDIANVLTDYFINANNAELMQRRDALIAQYMKKGLSKEKATKKADKEIATDFGMQLVESGLGGAISGGLLGGGMNVVNSTSFSTTGKAIQEGTGVTDLPTLVNVANTLGEDSAAYKMLEKNVLKNKNVSNAKVGELYYTTLQDIENRFSNASNIQQLTKEVGAITDAMDASNPDGITSDKFAVSVAQMFQRSANKLMSSAPIEDKSVKTETKAPSESKTINANATTEAQAAAPVKTSFKMNASAGGNNITLTTVDYTNDDEGIVFKTATGDSVKFTDIDFKNAATDKIVSDAIEPYDNISLGKNGANEFIRIMSATFGDDANAEKYNDYNETAKMFYNLGRSGVTLQNVLNDNRLNFSIDLLGVPAVKAMVNAGLDDMHLETQQSGVDRNANVKTTGKSKGGYVNETGKKDFDVLGAALAKATGTDIYVGNMGKGNGVLHTTKGIVELYDGSRRGLAHALGHEAIGEVLRAYNRADYNSIVDTVLAYATEISGAKSVADMVNAYYRTYAEDEAMTMQDAREELANDLISTLVFGNEHGQRVFAEHLASKQDQSIIDKFKDFVQKIIEAINNHFNKEGLSDLEKSMLQLDKERAEAFVSEIMNAWDTASENLKSQQGTAEVKSQQSVDINEDFAKQYDSWDKKNPRTRFVLGKTSKVLRNIGVRDADIRIDASKLIKIRNSHPEMTDEVIKQIPNIVNSPIIVMASKSSNSRITMFGDVISDGKPILAVLELYPTDKQGVTIDDIKVASAYGKDKAQNFINSSDVLYVDENKNRVKAWEQRTGLQLPVGSSAPNSINTISQPLNDVKDKQSRDVFIEVANEAFESQNGWEQMSFWGSTAITPLEVPKAKPAHEQFTDSLFKAIIGIQKAQRWNGKEITSVLDAAPEFDFIDRIQNDRGAVNELNSYLATYKTVDEIDAFQWFVRESRDKAYRKEHRAAIIMFNKACEMRIEEILAGKANGTKLGLKKGYASFDSVQQMFYQLNTNKDVADLAGKVFATIRRLQGDVNFKYEFVSNIDGSQIGRSVTKGQASGVSVHYNLKYFNSDAYSDQEKATTILHEMIHTVTVAALRGYGNIEQNKAISTINGIYNQIAHDKDFFNADGTRKYYGLKSATEMVAELANPQFRAALEKKSLFQRLIDAIKDFFGISTNNTLGGASAALENLIANADAVTLNTFARRATAKSFETSGEAINEIKKAKDEEYLTAANNGNDAAAQEFVDEAAMNWGAYSVDGKTPLKLYHGTRSFGFTEFDLDRMDDKRSIFLTSDLNTAQTYSGYEKTKTIIERINYNKIVPTLKLSSVIEKLNKAAMTTQYKIVDAAYVDRFESNAHLMAKEMDVDVSEQLQMAEKARGILKAEEYVVFDNIEHRVLTENQVRNELIEQLGQNRDERGNYSLYAKLKNPLIVDAQGRNWNQIDYYHEHIFDDGTSVHYTLNKTRDIAEVAKDEGYDAVVIKNVRDNGGRGIKPSGIADNIIIVFEPSNVKSADPITYNDNGDVIPLSERFSDSNDIRYSKDIDYKNAFEGTEYKKFYAAAMQNNQQNNLRIGDNGVLVPTENASDYKLVYYYEGSDSRLNIQAVYKLENFDYNIRDEKDNIANRIIELEEREASEQLIKKILQNATLLDGTIFKRYNRNSGRFAAITRGNNRQRNSNKQNIKAVGKEIAREGISETNRDVIKFSLDVPFDENDLDELYNRRIELQRAENEARNAVLEFTNSSEYKELIRKMATEKGDEEFNAAYDEYIRYKNESGYADAEKNLADISAELNTVQKRYKDLSENQAVADEAAAIKKSGLSSEEYFRKEALKEFGTTPYFYDAGYILTNGKMLNFSGEKGQHYGTRGEDHRAIGVIYANESGTDAMVRFMKDGNIRILDGTFPGIDIHTANDPTQAQYNVIKEYVESGSKTDFNVDFTGNDGRVIGNLRYEGNLNATRIVNDIKNYFATGELREQSQVDAFRHSKDVDFDNTSALIKENKKLQQTVDYYKLMLGYNNTEGGAHKVDREQIRKIAVALKKEWNSTMNTNDIADGLTELYDYISTGNATWDMLSDMGTRLGKTIVDNQKAELTAEQQEALDKLKTYNVSISDEQRDEIKYYYGSVAKWMNIVRKGVKYSTTGVSLDTVWQELAADMPYYFDADTNSQDMPMRLAEAVDAITDATENDYGYTADEMAQMIMLDVYDKYFEIPEIVTPLDIAKTQLDKERAANKERLEEVKRKDKEKYNRDVKRLKEYYQEMNKRLRDTKNQAMLDKLAKQKARYEDKARKTKDTQERSRLRASIRKQLNKILTMAAAPTKEKHIPNAIIDGVKALCEAVTLDGTQYDARLSEKLNNFRNGFVETNKGKENLYQTVSDLYNEYISDKIDELNYRYGNLPLKELPAPALREIRDLITMTGQTINNINRLFNMERNATIAGYADAIKNDMSAMRKEVLLDGVYKGFFYDLMKPEYFFEYLNSPTMLKLYRELRAGEDTWITLYHEAEEYKNELRKRTGYNDWKLDETHKFETVDGEIELTLGEMLAVYANSLGEHTRKNLIGGGFVNGAQQKGLRKVRNDHSTHRLSVDDVNAIVGELTKEQLQYVKQMIQFMSTTAGEWGNQVTRELYGVELYKEKSYYPALIASDFRRSKGADKTPPQTRQLVNSGFSKAIVPEVRLPLRLDDFDNTVMNHIVNMISYRSFVLPLENFDRVYHYVTVAAGDEGTLKYDSVEEVLKNAFGDKAARYIDNLVKDINGGAIASTDYTSKLTSLFKKGAVFASASVVVQQPSAIGRALSVLDAKYFVGNPLKGFNRNEYQEMLQYCPIARIKELGFFDTGLARSAVDSLNRKEYEGTDRVKAFITDGSYRDAAMSFFAQKADEITWTHIWNACKNEARDKYAELSEEEQLKKAAERFTEVITKTQVYDSVFSRAGVMRNSNGGMQMVTAFMAEPLTALNMTMNATIEAKRGNISKKQAAKTLGSLVLASAINAVLQTLVTAARHDKDDDDWKEVYLAELLPNFLDNINPAKQVPILRDVISIFDGYDVTRADMSIFVDLEKALKNLQKDSMTLDQKAFGLAGAIANCFGLPVRNVYRDVMGAVNVVKDIFDDYHFDSENAKEKFKEEMNSISSLSILNKNLGVQVFTTGTSARFDKMFKYVDKGKYQDAEKLLNEIVEMEKKAGKDEKDINSNIKSKITKHYKQPYLDGDANTRSAIVTYMTHTGIYGSRDDVNKYIKQNWLKKDNK